jgi:hypothetical protein
MSEWINHVKAYAVKNNITYKQALKDASPSYKTRNEKKLEEIPIIEPTIKGLQKKEEPTKFTRKNTTKKVVENITLKL